MTHILKVGEENTVLDAKNKNGIKNKIDTNYNLIYWYIPKNKEYFNNDEIFTEKVTAHLKNELEKYVNNKYKGYTPIIIVDDLDAREIEYKNKNLNIDNLSKKEREKILADLYNMEAEFYVDYERRYLEGKIKR